VSVQVTVFKKNKSSIIAGVSKKVLTLKTDTDTLNEKGVALILILWVVIFLGVIVNTFAWMVRTEVQAVGNFKEEINAYYLARGGFQRTIMELLKSQGSTDREPLKEGLKLDGRVNMVHFQDGHAEVRIIDESGKIDINVASRDDIIRVLTALDIEVEDKDVMMRITFIDSTGLRTIITGCFLNHIVRKMNHLSQWMNSCGSGVLPRKYSIIL